MDKKSFEEKSSDFNDNVNQLMVTGKSTTGVTFEEAFEIAENTPVEVMQELSSEYFKEWGNVGTEHVFLVTGFGTADLQSGGNNKAPVEVVKFMDKKRRMLINGDKTFVSGTKRLNIALPAFVKVVYENDVKGDAGTYKNLRVFSMPK